MMLKLTNVFLGVAAAGFLVGCGKGDSSSSSGGSAPSAPAPVVQAPAVQQPGAAAAPAPAGVPAPAPGAVAPPAGAAPSGSSEARMVGDDGEALSDLDMLNRLLMAYNDPATGPGAGDINPPPKPPIKDVQDLVKYRMIKAIPAAPAGKKFVYDAKANKIVLQ